MTSNANKTAVITGASSGVGFETARQFAEAGYGRIVITARTASKAAEAHASLLADHPTADFVPLTLDLDDLTSVAAAAQTLIATGNKIDVLILNAGVAPTPVLRRTAGGIEQIMQATLIGHHAFTMSLLDAQLLSPTARIIITGSEAARGDVPMFSNIDVDALAAASFGGDLERAIEAVLRIEEPVKYATNNQYATVKTFAVWWAKELASRLPAGMTVNVVSPGNTPGTQAARGMSALTRHVLLPIMKLIPSVAHSVPTAAARYSEAIAMGDDVTGRFFASPPKKMVGPLTEMTMSHFTNPEAQRALWAVTDRVARATSAEPK